jgi:hypothetical protein
MGEAEIVPAEQKLIIRSHVVTYGNAASEELTLQICEEIEQMWNEPAAIVKIGDKLYQVIFQVTGETKKDITDIEIYQNTDPRVNYFRIEEFVHGNISFVDGLRCNSGYFKLENLYKGSTTAAHEYGHTLGLPHPDVLDVRGEGVPGIMYPRGTLVDPQFQYEPHKPAGVNGGTMHPRHRRVRKEDVLDLRLHKLDFQNNKAIIGEFTNIYHPDHSTISAADFYRPPIFG